MRKIICSRQTKSKILNKIDDRLLFRSVIEDIEKTSMALQESRTTDSSAIMNQLSGSESRVTSNGISTETHSHMAAIKQKVDAKQISNGWNKDTQIDIYRLNINDSHRVIFTYAEGTPLAILGFAKRTNGREYNQNSKQVYMERAKRLLSNPSRHIVSINRFRKQKQERM